MFVIEANLDCESRWSNLPPSRAVLERISQYGLLLSALAPDDVEVEIWTPAAVDLARWRGRPVRTKVGSPPRADLRWADVASKPANDRRLAQRIANEVGALPWSASISLASGPEDSPPNRPIASDPISENNRASARSGADTRSEASAFAGGGGDGFQMTVGASARWRPMLRAGGVTREVSIDEAFCGSWIAKAAWTAAGRDRLRGDGPPNTEQQTRLARVLAAAGAIVIEPWCDRILDLGVCATVRDGRVTAEPPHSLLVDHRGGFVGIDLAEPALEPDERALLDRAVQAAGVAIAETGYAGPFAVDAFVYRDPNGERRLDPICEINARYSFGWVARAFAKRGYSKLGFGAAPDHATVLIADTGDRITAWVS